MILTIAELRDYLIRINELASGRWVQSDTELKHRIARITEEAIRRDDVMQGFLGYGGSHSDRDMLGGSGSLDHPSSNGTKER